MTAQLLNYSACSGPTTPDNITAPPDYIELQEGATNQNGEINFETGETISIVDNRTNCPLENIIVQYHMDEGGEYKVISITDSTETYLPAIRYFNDFEETSIRLQKLSEQEHTIRELSEEESGICIKFLEDKLLSNPERDYCQDYLGTYEGDDVYTAIDLSLEVMGCALGYFFPTYGGLIELVVRSATEVGAIMEGYESFENMITTENWDLNIDHLDSFYGIPMMLLHCSNQPSMNLETPVMDQNGNLIVQINISDKEYYEGNSFNDMTIPCANIWGHIEGSIFDQHNYFGTVLVGTVNAGYPDGFDLSYNVEGCINVTPGNAEGEFNGQLNLEHNEYYNQDELYFMWGLIIDDVGNVNTTQKTYFTTE